MNELVEQIEQLRRDMLATQPHLIGNLQALEAHLLHERDATLGHIRHIRDIRAQSEAIIRGELEALRDILLGRLTPPPIPDLEERFTPPRYLNGGLQ